MWAGVIVAGIDLAWGEKNDTGVCIAHDGHVVDSALVTSDQQIVETIAHWDDGVLLAAVDAPLVVANKVGRRPCEKVISRWMGARHAGAHSSNLSKPEFVDGPRAARIARALDLGVDPQAWWAGSTRQMIEVYPHPALVALFSLPVSLKYKKKSGRTVDFRKGEFVALVQHLEALEGAAVPFQVRCDRWAALCGELSSAQTHSALDRVEDEIDAYVCAYVGYLWSVAGDEKVPVIGDVATGYIVSPVCGMNGRVDADLKGSLHEALSALSE